MSDARWIVSYREHFWSRKLFERCERWYERWFLLAGRAIYVVYDSLRRDDVQQRASALALVTLISLVPALAVLFAILTMFTSLAQTSGFIKEFLLGTFSVTEDNAVSKNLDTFISNTNTSALGTVGVIFLLLSALSLLSNIETALNQIWGVKRGRSYLARFQVYWPIITLGPLLLGLSISATLQVVRHAPFLLTLQMLTPFAAASIFFTLLYRIVPNAKVKTIPALIGGTIAGALWVLAQRLFTMYARNAISYSQIYGSLGAIPLFILSVYISWIVILFGANLVFAIQTARSSEVPGSDAREMSLRDRERLAMLVMSRLADRYAGGRGATQISQLENAGWPPSSIRKTVADLLSGKLILEIESGDPEDPGYVPWQPPGGMSERDVISAIRGLEMTSDEELTLGEVDRQVLAAHREAEAEYLAVLAKMPVPPR